METERGLLPPHLKPISYEIRLKPHFVEQSFTGQVTICCDVVAVTRSIQLHCKCITITHAVVDSGGRSWDLNSSIIYDESQETVELDFREELSAGTNLKIALTYNRKFKRDLAGFYQANYTAEDETELSVAVNSMEPTYARQVIRLTGIDDCTNKLKVFPCFDEPDQKAEFVISTVVDSSFICISNMPVERTERVSKSQKLAVFEKSMPISTYLVALIAGPLGQVKSTKSQFPLSVFCPLGSETETQFALELAWDGLQLFENLFDSPYPLPKLDLVAVPDFAAGAMENWGIIRFRTNALLMDTNDSALDRKKYIAETVLHEISHMWFGNLVTMKYWDGLRLKEGFATLMAWFAMNKFFPGWQMWDSYVYRELQSGLGLDALESSHPVELVIKDAAEAMQMFDAISYKRGCCSR